MARLGYVRPGTDPEADRIFGDIQRLGRPVLNLYAELANRPPALAAFLSMSRYVRDESSLPPPLRELSILATAHALGSEYEIHQHVAVAHKVGLSVALIAAAAPGGDASMLDERERCAVDYAREAAAGRTCSDATFERMRALFTQDEVVDLVVTAAWYHLCAVILGTLRVDLEKEGA